RAALDDRGGGRSGGRGRAVDGGPLALRDRLVLHADAGDAEELARLVRVPVAPVIVPRVRGGPDVAVGLAGGGGIVQDVNARPAAHRAALGSGHRARGMP